MANVSRWKDFEKQVALALGGKRRFRTTENYGKIADDVKFSKQMRRQYPMLKRVAIECKKRKSMGIHAMFDKTKEKYGKDGKHIILASKITNKKRPALVTIELGFFKLLWDTWLGRDHERGQDSRS